MRRVSYWCLFAVSLLAILFPQSGWCVKCWNCENARNSLECSSSGRLMECRNDEVCSTEVRKDYGYTKMWKQCKQRKACENQRLQNWNRIPYFCNNDQDHSHCWCCCDRDSCNKNENCEVSSTQCPMPSLEIDHGHVTCSNSNLLGSLCTYTCNETGYHGFPLNKQNRLCLGNGKWSEKKPCCIKECPPNLPMDNVRLLQFNSEENFRKRHVNINFMFQNLTHSKEYYQEFMIYFNEKVYGVVQPDDLVRMGTYNASANNTANTGAALRYVRDNILGLFHRRSKHSDVIFVGVEKESDDDVTQAAADLRKDGVVIYYIFVESAEHKVNMEEARKVAFSEDHIFVVGGNEEGVYPKLFADLLTLACSQQCPNTEDE